MPGGLHEPELEQDRTAGTDWPCRTKRCKGLTGSGRDFHQAFSVASIDGFTLDDTSFTTVVSSPSVPAGSYVVNATVDVGVAVISSPVTFGCFITGASGNSSYGTLTPENGLTTIPLTDAVTLSEPSTVSGSMRHPLAAPDKPLGRT